MPADVVVNDGLGLAQFLTKHLDSVEAVSYLTAIEDITLEQWKISKNLLPGTSLSNFNTKEGYIKNIVSVLCESEIETQFVVGNLAVCPGFSLQALQFTNSYIAATLHCINTVTTCITQQATREGAVLPEKQSRSTNDSSRDKQTAPAAVTASTNVANTHTQDKPSYAGALLTPPSGGPPKPPPGPPKPPGRGGRKQREPTVWVEGKAYSEDSPSTRQLTPLCLGIQSGPEETKATVESAFTDKRWNGHKNLVVEEFSRNNYRSLFRVKLEVPVTMKDIWEKETLWPSRFWVTKWRGNPRKVLSTLDKRVYMKKVYVGNLTDTITMSQVEANMKKVYKAELDKGIIATIEAFENLPSLTKQKKRQDQDPSYAIRRSACVVIKSKEGKSLSEVGLNLNEYSMHRRRYVKYWTGPVPWPQEVSSKSPNNLTW